MLRMVVAAVPVNVGALTVPAGVPADMASVRGRAVVSEREETGLLVSLVKVSAEPNGKSFPPALTAAVEKYPPCLC